MGNLVRLLLAGLAFSAIAVLPHARPAPLQQRATAADTAFAALVARLSEPGGYFDTDNLISNEASYLHPVGALRTLDVRGGAYVGVGPDQNFSYIAAVRPQAVYIIDIRRDNMLQHLLFKALFARSANRMEYLCRWLGYPVPADVQRWSGRDIGEILAYLDAQAPNENAARAERAAVLRTVRGFGVPLDARDTATVARFHAEFQQQRLDLRFTSHNRGPRPGYPSLRELILQTDLAGRQASYLAREEDWRFVKSLQQRNLVIPVVGDLAGPHALAAIGRDAAARGLVVSALYVSNVEQYLWRDGTFDRFARSAANLPRGSRSVLIRSYFGRNFGSLHPQDRSRGSSVSAQLMQSLTDFATRWSNGGWQSYWELVTQGALDLAAPRLP